MRRPALERGHHSNLCLNHSMARCLIPTISTFLALHTRYILSRFLTFPRVTSGANTMSTLCSVKRQTAYMLCASLIAYISLHPHPRPSPYLNTCAAAFENTLLTFGPLHCLLHHLLLSSPSFMIPYTSVIHMTTSILSALLHSLLRAK